MNWFTILSNIVATLIIYLAYPFSHLYIYGKSSKKKAMRIALLNTAIASTIYCFIGSISTAYNYVLISIIPAIVYYFISWFILVDTKSVDVDYQRNHYSADAVTGFVLSLVGVFVCGLIYGVVGLIFSALGLKSTAGKDNVKGGGLAIAGLAISIIDIMIMLVYGLLLIIL